MLSHFACWGGVVERTDRQTDRRQTDSRQTHDKLARTTFRQLASAAAQTVVIHSSRKQGRSRPSAPDFGPGRVRTALATSVRSSWMRVGRCRDPDEVTYAAARRRGVQMMSYRMSELPFYHDAFIKTESMVTEWAMHEVSSVCECSFFHYFRA